jgi:hypothetical protein
MWIESLGRKCNIPNYWNKSRQVRKLLNMNLPLLVILSLLVSVGSLLLDIAGGFNELWFQRSGSILVVLGGLFEAKYILRTHEEGQTVFRGTLVIETDEPDDQEPFGKRAKKHAGFVVVLLGTLIWGYGDLVESFF